MVFPHPDYDRFARACVSIQNNAKACTRIGFRFTALKYAKSKDLLSGEGAKRSGGRVNAAGTFPVIYTSTDPQTATAETFQNFTDFGFDKDKIKPRVIVGVEIRVCAVLDLCDLEIRRRLKVTLADLAEAWWPAQEAGAEALTQAIGRAAYAAGFEAVALPSVRRRGGINFNVFPGNLRVGSFIKVLAESELQRYLK